MPRRTRAWLIYVCIIRLLGYNTEKYLRESLDSVLRQTYKNLEVILVEDGSTDGSGKICDEYSEKDSRFHVIHRENGKAGNISVDLIGSEYVARNIAINHAHGDYYMFLDSDDYWLSENVVGDIVELLKESQADMLSFEYIEFFNENKRPSFLDGSLPRNDVFKKEPDTALKALLKKPPSVFSSVPHTKVIKAEFIKKNNIHFPEGLNCEDVFFTAEIIRNAKTYDRYNKTAYAFRRTNKNSQTSQQNQKYKIAKNILSVFDMVFEVLKKEKTSERDPVIYKRILDFLASPYAYMLGMVAGALEFCEDAGEKKEIKNDIKKMKVYSFVTKYSSRLYIKFIGAFFSILGLNATIYVLKQFLKLNNRHVLSVTRKTNKEKTT